MRSVSVHVASVVAASLLVPIPAWAYELEAVRPAAGAAAPTGGDPGQGGAPTGSSPSGAAPASAPPGGQGASAESAGAGPSQGAPAAGPGATPTQGGPAQDEAERKKLEAEIAKELGGSPGAAQPTAPPAAPGPAQQGAPPPPQGGSPFARLLLIPDISAIGSAGLVYDSYDVAGLSPRTGWFGPSEKPTFFFQELELGLQAVVDPYARADVFLSFTPEGAGIEEAYATFLTLPAGLQLRAGEFYSPFGRMNQQHPHVWEFVDAPLARSRLLAQDVLSGPGVDLAWLAPVPWFAELHVTAQGTAPYPDQRSQPTVMARLLQYVPAGDRTTVGVGLSAAQRWDASGAYRELGGADVYVRYKPVQSQAYLALQGEVYLRKLRGEPGASAGTDYGWWAQAFWRHDAWWGYGLRYEEAPEGSDGTGPMERRASAVATWFPTEFERVRVQGSWDRLPGGHDGLEALLYLEFIIGAHGAHPF